MQLSFAGEDGILELQRAGIVVGQEMSDEMS
jgi:hypothetical protein